MCPTRTTAVRKASSRCSTWSKPPAWGCFTKSGNLFPSLDLLQLLVLRRRLRALAPRTAQMLRLLGLRRELRLAAVGFDHHQARTFEQRLGVDLRLLALGLLALGLLVPRLLMCRFRFAALRFASLVFPHLFVAWLFLPEEGWRLSR